MAEADDGQEKTLDPTPQRIARAREKGDIAKSNDVNAAAAYLGLLAVLVISAEQIAMGVAAPLTAFIGAPQLMSDTLLGPGGSALALHYLFASISSAAPLYLVPALAVIIALLSQRAVIFAPSKIEPKLSRLNPIANAKQKFGLGGLVEFAKSATKLFAIAIVLVIIFRANHDGIEHFMLLDAHALPKLLLDEAMLLLAPTLGIAGVIAALDILWQKHQHIKKLQMSHQEMKEETKNTEGDPMVKSARRERAREIAMNRMLEDVPKADVVIVNPTHYAVALEWARTPGSAPTCVAKGVDEIAARIREAAQEHGVPIHSDPPSARALHATVEIGDEIRLEHYQAVAVAIRFADMARQSAKRSKGTA